MKLHVSGKMILPVTKREAQKAMIENKDYRNNLKIYKNLVKCIL